MLVLRLLCLIGLAACFLSTLSGCPAEDDSSSAPGAKDSAKADDHSHRWDGVTDAAGAVQPTESLPAPPGDGAPGEEAADASGQGAGGAAPEATIVHADLGPEELVRHYLMLGSAGDLSRIADYVDPRCYKGPIGRVDAVRLVGTLMTLDALSLAPVFQTEEKARVNYHLVGGVAAGEKKPEITIGGEEVAARAAILNTEDVERRGWLDLAFGDGLWRVTCAFSYAPPQDTSSVTP